MYVIVVYIPSDHVLNVVQALANAGAGEIGNYRACSFQVKGQGQFEPQAGAEPFIGDVGILEVVEEVRVEMVCEQEKVKEALQAMLDSHPYEEPAYHVIAVKTLADFC
ncbi:hypothetical protein [Reinekea sp. G2M2-21]|uniref:hypothetical protein n=1 Tax=Reinekea sp. G2M2-21 TaxID=2788942 RepID=UPI0018AC1493|nr:hypothetical protein [Reinekea sp. G2M2-21]